MAAELTADVKEFALQAGADLVGIGSMDRFEGAPKNYDPRYIFPEAQAVIGLGFRIHRGLLRGIEEGTLFSNYPSLGYANVNDIQAPLVLRQVGSFLEDEGYEAVLYSNTMIRYGSNRGMPVSPDKPSPDVFLHFRIAAYICGMGEIGHSKVFLTPQFGPRQRFAFIFTDAPLEPDPIYSGPPLCDRCMRCAAECPAGAIPLDRFVKVNVAGREIQWGDLDVARCNIGFQAASAEYNPFADAETAKLIGDVLTADCDAKERAARSSRAETEMRQHFGYVRNAREAFHHPPAICGGRGCIRACMIHLEESGRVSNTFKGPFRKRRPWRLPAER
jgi:ferredoxin